MSTRDVFLGTGHLLELSYVQLQQQHINHLIGLITLVLVMSEH